MDINVFTFGTKVLVPRTHNSGADEKYRKTRAVIIGLPVDGMIKVMRECDKRELVLPVNKLILD